MSDDFDNVNRPKHYNVCGGLDEDNRSVHEPIKVIEDWGLGWGFCVGNAIKYVLRAAHKGEERKDIKKARWYALRAAQSAGDVQPVLCYPFAVGRSWGLSARLSRALELLSMGKVAHAAHELEKHLDEHFPGWSEIQE